MKKAIIIALIFVIVGLLVIIFARSSDTEEPFRNYASAATESTTDSLNSKVAQGDVTEPTSIYTQETEPEVKTTFKPETSEDEGIELDYVLNTNTKKFHYTSCKSVEEIKDKNREDYHGTRDKLIDSGFSPCGRCKP